MKKFVLTALVAFGISFFAFADVIDQPSSVIGQNQSEISIGGHVNYDMVVGSREDALNSLDGQFFIEFTKDMGRYYTGGKIGLMAMSKGYNPNSNSPDSMVAGFSAQGVIGISKELVREGNFLASAFAEGAAGVIVSPSKSSISGNYDEDGQHIMTEYQPVLSPQVGVSLQIDCFTFKAFWTTNWIRSTGVGDASLGFATGIAW